ncbi:MAG: hypothetical protein LQ343_006688 [Gyalolechia ehrenbergii]|nr:MAG: hypothetical protein LQ343_006688 [Gyalolechia ehrenbergii]
MDSSCGEGWQPLHHATFFGSSMLVVILLQGGANPHATTNEGTTASSLGFCTSDTPIAEDEKDYILNLLRESSNRTNQQRNFKVGIKKASTVEEKNNLFRTAACSTMVVSRPHLHKANTTAQTSHRASTGLDPASSSHRPRLQHLPYTSPLPSKDILPHSIQQCPPNSSLPTSQPEMKIPTLPSTPDLSCTSTDTAALTVAPIVYNSTTSRVSQPSETTTANTALVISADVQPSAQPNPLLKRHSASGLTKGNPGVDPTKLSLASIGKPTFEIGTKTLEIGKQGIEMTRQGLDLGRKGVEAIQGLEVGKQSREIGKRGMDRSKPGYKSAKKFAQKGKLGGASKAGKAKAGAAKGSKEGREDAENGTDGNDDDEDDDECDDAKSTFSLGGFGELGESDLKG